MTFRVRTLKRAESDLFEIRDYIRRDSPESANGIIEQLLDAIGSLGRSAKRGARPRDERLRRILYRFLVSGRYLIFYKIDEKRSLVLVHRVLHGKRAYAEIL